MEFDDNIFHRRVGNDAVRQDVRAVHDLNVEFDELVAIGVGNDLFDFFYEVIYGKYFVLVAAGDARSQVG